MKVCCVEGRRLPECISRQTAATPEDWRRYIGDGDVRWVERSDAEHDTAYRQFIPYVLVQDAAGRFACYPRHGTEERLRGLYSCGVGGHVEECDRADTLEQTLRNGMLRELGEELAGFSEDRVRLEYLGMIHEVESEVGLCHLGLAYCARCEEGYVPVATDETTGLEWKTVEELRALRRELWSDLALSLVDRTEATSLAGTAFGGRDQQKAVGRAFCLLNHPLTERQLAELRDVYGAGDVVYPPAAVAELWAQVPPLPYLRREDIDCVSAWLGAARGGEVLVVQGEVGATFALVDWALSRHLVPVHAVTRRVEREEREGEKVFRHYVFEHVCFRRYHYYADLRNEEE